MARHTTLSLAGLGARLRAQRKAQDLSQEDLAQALGAPQSWISEIERGKQTRLELETFYRLCVALDCSADALLDLAPHPPRRPHASAPWDVRTRQRPIR